MRFLVARLKVEWTSRPSEDAAPGTDTTVVVSSGTSGPGDMSGFRIPPFCTHNKQTAARIINDMVPCCGVCCRESPNVVARHELTRTSDIIILREE